MVKLPPNHYCVIKNPVVRDADGNLVNLLTFKYFFQVNSEYGEVQVKFEEVEIRTQNEYPDPFPLYPYEELVETDQPFIFLKDNEALLLKAKRPFTDTRGETKVERYIEDEYLFRGPGTYIPRVEESIDKKIEALIVLPNSALLLLAKKDFKDSFGIQRHAGEQVISQYLVLTDLIVAAQKDWILHANS